MKCTDPRFDVYIKVLTGYFESGMKFIALIKTRGSEYMVSSHSIDVIAQRIKNRYPSDKYMVYIDFSDHGYDLFKACGLCGYERVEHFALKDLDVGE